MQEGCCAQGSAAGTLLFILRCGCPALNAWWGIMGRSMKQGQQGERQLSLLLWQEPVCTACMLLL